MFVFEHLLNQMDAIRTNLQREKLAQQQQRLAQQYNKIRKDDEIKIGSTIW